MEREIWKSSSNPNFEISNFGRLRKCNTKEIKKLYLNSSGY